MSPLFPVKKIKVNKVLGVSVNKSLLLIPRKNLATIADIDDGDDRWTLTIRTKETKKGNIKISIKLVVRQDDGKTVDYIRQYSATRRLQDAPRSIEYTCYFLTSDWIEPINSNPFGRSMSR